MSGWQVKLCDLLANMDHLFLMGHISILIALSLLLLRLLFSVIHCVVFLYFLYF